MESCIISKTKLSALKASDEGVMVIGLSWAFTALEGVTDLLTEVSLQSSSEKGTSV